MKTSVATAGVAAALVAVSLLAVPAVASGADYLAASQTLEGSASAAYLPTAATSDAGAAASSAVTQPADLSVFVTMWGASGVLLLSGGALAVGISARKQRSIAV